jgi:hypothetical protein
LLICNTSIPSHHHLRKLKVIDSFLELEIHLFRQNRFLCDSLSKSHDKLVTARNSHVEHLGLKSRFGTTALLRRNLKILPFSCHLLDRNVTCSRPRSLDYVREIMKNMQSKWPSLLKHRSQD